jgi:molybdopterin converting factor small subunit
MTVRVDLNPILKRQYYPGYDAAQGLILEDAAGKTLSEIVQELEIPFDEISSALVNHRVEQPGYKVKDGDSIYLTIAISGG